MREIIEQEKEKRISEPTKNRRLRQNRPGQKLIFGDRKRRMNTGVIRRRAGAVRKAMEGNGRIRIGRAARRHSTTG